MSGIGSRDGFEHMEMHAHRVRAEVEDLPHVPKPVGIPSDHTKELLDQLRRASQWLTDQKGALQNEVSDTLLKAKKATADLNEIDSNAADDFMDFSRLIEDLSFRTMFPGKGSGQESGGSSNNNKLPEK